MRMIVIAPLSSADRRRMFLTAGVFLTILVTIAYFQTSIVVASSSLPRVTGSSPARLLAGVLPVWVTAGLFAVQSQKMYRAYPRGLLTCLWVAVVGAGLRVAMQVALEVYQHSDGLSMGSEFAVGTGVGFATLALTFARSHEEQRERAGQIEAALARARAERAVDALREEEVRVRRVVADGLHGTLQQRLVMFGAELAHVRDELAGADPEAGGPGCADPAGDEPKGAETGVDLGPGARVRTAPPPAVAQAVRGLDGLMGQLDVLREETVRATSRLLAPEGLNVGLVAAVRLLLGRLPSSIRYDLEVCPAVRRLDGSADGSLGPDARLLVVRVVEEALTNGLRHGQATAFRVMVREVVRGRETEDDGGLMAGPPSGYTVDTADEPPGYLRVEVHNNGTPFTAPEEALSGLARLRDRVELVGGTLQVGPGTGALKGMHTAVVARVPVQRIDELSA